AVSAPPQAQGARDRLSFPVASSPTVLLYVRRRVPERASHGAQEVESRRRLRSPDVGRRRCRCRARCARRPPHRANSTTRAKPCRGGDPPARPANIIPGRAGTLSFLPEITRGGALAGDRRRSGGAALRLPGADTDPSS